MRIRRKLLHFLHEKIFRHDMEHEPNKFTYFIYKILFPFTKSQDLKGEDFKITQMKGTEEQFVGHNFDHFNLQPRPYGKQYTAFINAIAQIEAGQNTVFLGRKWMLISMDYYHKITETSKSSGKSFKLPPNYKDWPQEYKDYLNGDWNISEPKGFASKMVKMQDEVNLHNRKKREETMKSNIGIARVCHEANRQYCIDNQLEPQPNWDGLPSNVQGSIIAGVVEVLANPKVTPAEMHQKWVDYKTERGWIYGKVKNVKVQTHPNLVPYKKLSKEERRKDVLFIMTVRREMKIIYKQLLNYRKKLQKIAIPRTIDGKYWISDDKARKAYNKKIKEQ